MKIGIKSKKIVLPNGLLDGYVYMEAGKIISVGKEKLPCDKTYDVGDDFLLPGFIDIHTHGAYGCDYAESGADGIIRAVKYSVSRGATSVMPTVASSSYDSMCSALSNIEKAMQDRVYGKCIAGAHLEGPYFSLEQCGAQNTEYITEPIEEDYKRIIERFGKTIKRWDYAPERDKGGSFCEYLTEHGIVASAGHTDAKYEDMLTARAKGCKLITHLYSCTSTITRESGYRKLGVTECGYLFDDLFVEIIADGRHLPEELIKLVFKLKPKDKIILITDSLKVAGTEEKSGNLNGIDYIIEDGVCKLTDKSAFAGSIATAETLLKVCHGAGISINDISRAGSENPAKLFGLNTGRMETGYDADLITADEKMNVKKVFVNGEEIC